MILSIKSTIVLFGLFLASDAGDSAKTSVIDQGTCGPTFLKNMGVDVDKYKPVIQLSDDQLSVTPEAPVIPGCFNLSAKNLVVDKNLDAVTALFELRFGPYPSGDNRAQDCRAREDTCPCGIDSNSCLFCDFCKHLNSVDKTVERNGDKDGAAPKDSCMCDIKKGSYDFNFRLCTPEAEEIKKSLPESVVSTLERKPDFNLWVTLLLFDTRFQSLESMPSPQKEQKFEDEKAKRLIGCHLVGINVHVNA